MKIKSSSHVSRSLVCSISYAINVFYLGMQQLQDIDEVNMFKDDNTVIHLKKPQCKLKNTPTHSLML